MLITQKISNEQVIPRTFYIVRQLRIGCIIYNNGAKMTPKNILYKCELNLLLR